jgi:hypothetical protein
VQQIMRPEQFKAHRQRQRQRQNGGAHGGPG